MCTRTTSDLQNETEERVFWNHNPASFETWTAESRETKRILVKFQSSERLLSRTDKFLLLCFDFSHMLKFICKTSHHIMSAAKASPTHFYFFRFHRTQSSTSVNYARKSSNQRLFTVTYLIESCGFTSEKALSTSRYVEFGTRDKPDSVLSFFKNRGFTQTQISSAIRQYPAVLLCDVQKTLLPKLEFLKSKGLSSVDVARITSISQFILQRSLKNSIIPSFSFFEKFLQSKEKAVVFIRRYAGLLLFDHQSTVIRNIEILREKGALEANIMFLLMNQPRSFVVSNRRFRECVDEVEKMGLNPSKMNFMLALLALRGMTKSTREKKAEVYKKWGCTKDEIFVAFKKHPGCMRASENKINGVMDFCVNKMGWESSFVATRPTIISMSLQKRIIPRNAVYQVLLSKGLTKSTDISLMTLLQCSETQFLKKVCSYHEEEARELLKLYNEMLDLAK